jgi:glycosyltransferase involved in cell wall biosynthesis
MRIALVHHIKLPVRGYGGTERVVVALARGLAVLGHEVILIAPPGTRVPEARLVAVEATRLTDPRFDLAPTIPAGVEIVHAFFPLRAASALPWVWTLEGTTRPGLTRPPNTIYVSADHAARHSATCFVYNGLDPADFEFRDHKGDYDLFLGRLHNSKGYQWAIAGARAARRSLVVAGGWRPSLTRQLRFAGLVDGAEKRELLAGARLLWMPALWDEPFGLTLIEALWSGTPVLATRRGALPEVLSPAVAEFGDDPEELVARLPAMATKEPAACRARAERYFSHHRMADEYLRVYREFLTTGTLPAGIRTEG